jgi:hypothetical protein
VPASFGAPDLELWSSPLPELLREVTGFEPEPGANHVRLDDHLGTRSAQRLALADVGGNVVAGLWPGELKAQARYLYADGRAHSMFAAARQRGWTIEPRPALAFFNSHPSQRLYMTSTLSPEEYADRWQGPDADMIGRFPPEEMPSIRAWLAERGYLGSRDTDAVERFERALGRRNVDVRPGLMLTNRFPRSGEDLARTIRNDVSTILSAAGDPRL